MQPGSSPLDQLADIHLPDSVSWWPLAPGWWILMGVFILMVVALLRWRQHKVKRRYRQDAINRLQHAYAQYQANHQSVIYLQRLSELLRRTALTSYGSQFNPSIKGDAWLEWLDHTCPNLPQKFVSDSGRLLLTGPYQKQVHVELEALHQLSLEWIQKHRTGKAMRNNLPAQGARQHV